jgi:hypothetical protein
MTAGQSQNLAAEPTGGTVGSPTREWLVAAVLFGLMLAVGIRQGGFWRADALIAAVAAVAILVVAIVVAPPDRRSWLAIISVVLLALWWFLRAQGSGSLAQFLPLGASFLAFVAAFAAVRPLRGRPREAAGLGIACLGAAGALVGFAGLIWRWYPMAMPAQGLWRLSTTLTYSDAAGLVLGVCLLVALGTDLYPVLVRMAVCLCAGGLMATQSRGAYIAIACGCLLVPWQRYVRSLVPLIAGAGLGVAAIVSSPDTGRVPWLGAILIIAVGVAAVARWDVGRVGVGVTVRLAIAAVLLCAVSGALVLLHHEIGLRAFAPSDQDRSVEWSTALHQWATAPILGVGPDRLLQFHASDGTYAHFVHNEFLQIAADGGVVGVVLLGFSAISIFRVASRFDVLSSCASSALVCWSVAAVFDFDWHLTLVGFLGGWCVGLAHNNVEEVDEESRQGDDRRRRIGSSVRDSVPLGRRIAREFPRLEQ